MENKINIADLLRDCPKGMELDCTLFEGLEFDGIVDNEYLPIRCRIKNPCGGYNVCNFTKYGCWLDTTFAKCIIFPKGKTTWEGFTPPCQFKDGDIVANQNGSGTWIGIYHEYDCLNETFTSYCYIRRDGTFYANSDRGHVYYKTRLATEEEKQKFFKVIKDNGYHWNNETKTLEKLVEPMFKINNIIRHKERKSNTRIVDIKDGNYIFENGDIMPIYLQNDYEFITDKFDINTLKPFDKVLVRDKNRQGWCISFFSHCNGLETYKYSCINDSGYAQCIPYNEDTKHLLGTTNDCDDFYKTWE